MLDLFAGSGALGLEALSRGAREVVLVDSHPRAVATVRANVATLGLPGAVVVDADVFDWVAAPAVGEHPGPEEGAFDVVLADPPYALEGERVTGLLADLLDAAPDRPRRGGRGRALHPLRGGDLAGRAGGGAEPPLRRGDALVRSPPVTRPLRTAVCPGSFDPVTNGHLDIIGRASVLYDQVVVGVLVNKNKKSLFTVAERMDMLREVTAGYGNVVVDSFYGLLVDWCRAHDVSVIVKGLRAVSDFDYELQMGQMNHSLASVETMFMPTNPLYSFLSSSLVKEVATYGGDVSGLLPESVRQALVARLAEQAEPAP